MAAWKPNLKPGVDLRALPLSPEEGFVASRLDGTTDVHALSLVTGFQPAQIDSALRRLVELGAVDPAREPAHDAPEDDEEPLPEQKDERAVVYRQLYETQLHPLDIEERAARAATAVDPELSALCFDPVPKVIQSLLNNQRFGLSQARLVAAHHRNAAGLEALATRGLFVADQGVQRALLRNPQLAPALLRRLYAGKRLVEHYKLATSREVPEQTRRTARELLRARFVSGAAEEKVELILKTEGRCLASLVGLPVDAKTSALLCGRTYSSTTLVQNIARWAPAPPPLIAHLLRQEAVRRSPTLKTLLLRHPNAPPRPDVH